MNENQKPGIFAFLALLVLILAVPQHYIHIPRPVELNVFLLLWIGVALSAALSYMSSTGLTISLFPCFQAFLVAGGSTLLLELGFFSAAIVGTFALCVRFGMKPMDSLLPAAVRSLTAFASLRIACFLFSILATEQNTGYLSTLLIMTLAIPVLVFFNIHLRSWINLKPIRHSRQSQTTFLQILTLPVLSSPLLVPATAVLASGADDGNGVLLVSMASGTFAVLAVQMATTIVFEKSKYARGRAIEAERAMSELSGNLASCESPLQALRFLADTWFRTAKPESIRVSWKNVSCSIPSNMYRPENRPLKRQGRSGLVIEIWPKPGTALDSDRMDAFISLTETALLNQELHRTVTSETWNFMEAMVYSLDRSDHRMSGYSKRVAELALNIGRKLKLQPRHLENLRMAALLHHVAPLVMSAEKERKTSFSSASDMARYHLPEETMETLMFLSENYDGSGQPNGLKDTAIPVQARILSVAEAFIRTAESIGETKALVEIRLRSGSIFDPSVVGLLNRLKSP